MLFAQDADQHDGQGRQAIVRHGYLPARAVHTGLGAVRVQGPRVRDRSGAGRRLHAALLPPYLRRSKSLEALVPWLSLTGVSTGDCSEAFQALLGPAAPGLSPATLRRLHQGGQAELAPWQQRDLTGTRYGYFWGDGVYLETRLEDARHGIVGRIGADATGQKELGGLWEGSRESAPAWKELLLALHSRGLAHGPTLAMGAGALGCWPALRHVDGQTRWQRCWVPQTAQVLDKLPKDLQPQAKQRLQAIGMAPDRQRAALAFALCMATDAAQYPKAAECLAPEREEV